MSKVSQVTLATVVLLGSVALATAQTTQDPHHPDTVGPAAKPVAPMPAPNGAAGVMPMPDMTKMMGGDMRQMMSMMPTMMRAMHEGMMQGGGMGMMPFDHIEGRIAFFKAELGITETQLPQWNAFADAMRGSAKGMQTAMGAMMQAGMPATAPARMEARVQMMSARLDAMKATLAAAKSLYGVLSDVQKKTADELMAEPGMGMGMGMRAGGMGARQ